MGHAVQLASADHGLAVDRVRAGHIQGNRIEGSEHAHIRNDGDVVLRMAVAVRGYVDNQADVEAWPSGNHRLAVFRDLAVQDIVALVAGRADRIHRADADTPAAAHAFVMVDGRLSVRDGGSVMGADLDAAAAAHAQGLIHMGLSGAVHLHLSGAGAAAHADVLQSAAEARIFMALEMAEGDEHIRVHDGASDLGFLHIFSALHGNQDLIRPLQAVGDDHVTARGKRRKAVLISRIQMIQRVFSSAHIQGVAVGQKRLSAQLLHHLHHHGRIVGPQEGQISGLSEMDLNGRILVLEIDAADARRLYQPFQLLRKVF